MWHKPQDLGRDQDLARARRRDVLFAKAKWLSKLPDHCGFHFDSIGKSCFKCSAPVLTIHSSSIGSNRSAGANSPCRERLCSSHGVSPNFFFQNRSLPSLNLNGVTNPLWPRLVESRGTLLTLDADATNVHDSHAPEGTGSLLAPEGNEPSEPHDGHP